MKAIGSNKKMKPNKWQKTVITWNPHYNMETDIPIDDLKGYTGTHTVQNLKAISVTDTADTTERTAILTFNILRGCIGPTTRKDEILKKLKSLSDSKRDFYVNVSADEFGGGFKITFNLRDPFCEEVINFIRFFMSILGIKDTKDYHLSDFSIKSTTMHRQGEGWIPFEEYFKLTHGLYIGELSVEIMPDTKPLG